MKKKEKVMKHKTLAYIIKRNELLKKGAKGFWKLMLMHGITPK